MAEGCFNGWLVQYAGQAEYFNGPGKTGLELRVEILKLYIIIPEHIVHLQRTYSTNLLWDIR